MKYKQLPTNALEAGMTIIYGQGRNRIVELLPCEGRDPLARLQREGSDRSELQLLPTYERSFTYPYGMSGTLRMWTVRD
jgi:hypothetical protein